MVPKFITSNATNFGIITLAFFGERLGAERAFYPARASTFTKARVQDKESKAIAPCRLDLARRLHTEPLI